MSANPENQPEDLDRIDRLLAEWQLERPELDAAPMAVEIVDARPAPFTPIRGNPRCPPVSA